MALKVELKPHERIIIGSCVITNTDQRARLLIDGDNVPILREKDILTPEVADTPDKLIYRVTMRPEARFHDGAKLTAHDVAFSLTTLKAKGHPVGATGVGQICDVVQQIRGDADERQVKRNSLGLAQNLGGSGATSVVTILGAA